MRIFFAALIVASGFMVYKFPWIRHTATDAVYEALGYPATPAADPAAAVPGVSPSPGPVPAPMPVATGSGVPAPTPGQGSRIEAPPEVNLDSTPAPATGSAAATPQQTPARTIVIDPVASAARARKRANVVGDTVSILRLRDGRTFTGVQITKVTASKLSFMHDNGGSSISLALLDDQWQAKTAYDADETTVMAAAEEKAEKERVARSVAAMSGTQVDYQAKAAADSKAAAEQAVAQADVRGARINAARAQLYNTLSEYLQKKKEEINHDATIATTEKQMRQRAEVKALPIVSEREPEACPILNEHDTALDGARMLRDEINGLKR